MTVVKRGEILSSLILNYISGEIVIACKDYIETHRVDGGSTGIKFNEPKNGKTYLTYLGKAYRQHLEDSKLLNPTFTTDQIEPGGPMRVLYLSNLNPSPQGFILANGEKIGEWIGWLAFCRYSRELGQIFLPRNLVCIKG